MKRESNINQRFDGCGADTTFDFSKVAIGDAQSIRLSSFILLPVSDGSYFMICPFRRSAVRADVQLLVGSDRSDTCGA